MSTKYFSSGMAKGTVRMTGSISMAKWLVVPTSDHMFTGLILLERRFFSKHKQGVIAKRFTNSFTLQLIVLTEIGSILKGKNLLPKKHILPVKS